jgi:hypothetical protein
MTPARKNGFQPHRHALEAVAGFADQASTGFGTLTRSAYMLLTDRACRSASPAFLSDRLQQHPDRERQDARQYRQRDKSRSDDGKQRSGQTQLLSHNSRDDALASLRRPYAMRGAVSQAAEPWTISCMAQFALSQSE